MSDTRTLRVLIVGNSRSAQKALRGLDGEVQRTAGRTQAFGSRLGRGMLIAGRNVALGMGIATAAASTFVYRVGADYERSLNNIQALTDASSATMESAAKRIEATSGTYAKMGFTVKEAAFGVEQLTKAGMSLEDSLTAVNATMTVAKAGNIEVGTSASLVSNMLNTFGLKAEKATVVAGSLANAANRSSADIDDLRLALGMVGNVADNSGMTIQQTSAALAVLANNGMRGSDAGTSLKTMLLRLIAPSTDAKKTFDMLGISIYDQQGRLKEFTDIVGDLAPALAELDEEARNGAIKKIFGDDAFRAAKVLLGGDGPEALRKMTRGLGDYSAAQRLAEARSKGFSGAVARGKALTESAAQTLYRRMAPALGEVAHGLIDTTQAFVKRISPAIEDFAEEAGPKIKKFFEDLEPKMEDLIDKAEPLTEALWELGKSVSKMVLPYLKSLFDILGTLATVVGAAATALKPLVDAFNALPDFIKGVAFALLLLTPAAGRINAVTTALGTQITTLRAWGGEVRNAQTRAAALATGWGKVGEAVKGISTAGGLAMLTTQTEDASSGASVLKDTLGGALVGFGVGGPWGAAAGAVGGLTLGLVKAKRATDASREANYRAMGIQADYASTFDQTTGAISRATKALVYDTLTKGQGFRAAADLGISQRTLIDSILGEKDAREQVQSAIDAQTERYNNLGASIRRLERERDSQPRIVSDRQEYDDRIAAIQAQRDAIKENVQIIREETNALAVSTAEWVKKRSVLTGLPKRVITKFQTNAPKTFADVAKVAEKFRLTPKKVQTTFKQYGIDASKKQIEALNDRIKELNEADVDLKGAREGVKRGTKEIDGIVRGFAGDFQQDIYTGTGKAKPNLNPFSSAIKNGLQAISSAASGQSQAVGNNMRVGMTSGFFPVIQQMASIASQAVSAAMQAARREGEIKSPSRKMMVIGRYLAEGMGVGLDDPYQKNKTTNRVKSIVQRVIRDFDGKNTSLKIAKSFRDINIGNAIANGFQSKGLEKIAKAITEVVKKGFAKGGREAADSIKVKPFEDAGLKAGKRFQAGFVDGFSNGLRAALAAVVKSISLPPIVQTVVIEYDDSGAPAPGGGGGGGGGKGGGGSGGGNNGGGGNSGGGNNNGGGGGGKNDNKGGGGKGEGDKGKGGDKPGKKPDPPKVGKSAALGKELSKKVAKMPMLAKGGIVKKATAAIIGEKGKEAVVPLKGDPLGIGSVVKSVAQMAKSTEKAISDTRGERLLENALKGGINNADKRKDLKEWLKESTTLGIEQLNRLVNGNANDALNNKLNRQLGGKGGGGGGNGDIPGGGGGNGGGGGGGGGGGYNPDGNDYDVDVGGGALDGLKKFGENYVDELKRLKDDLVGAVRNSDSWKDLKDALHDMRENIRDAFTDGDITAEMKSTLMDLTDTEKGFGKDMKRLIEQREKLLERMENAQEKLEKAKDELANLESEKESLWSSVRDASRTSGSLMGSLADDTPENGYNTPSAILGRFSKRLENMRNFARNIRTLIKDGWAPGIVSQIAAEGPDAGGQIAAVLAGVSMNTSVRDDFSKIQSDLMSESNTFGDDVGKYVYDKRIDSARDQVRDQRDVVQNIKIDIQVNGEKRSDLASEIAAAVREEIQRINKRQGK